MNVSYSFASPYRLCIIIDAWCIIIDAWLYRLCKIDAWLYRLRIIGVTLRKILLYIYRRG